MYLDEYKRWLAADLEDADLKPELAKVEGNDDEIKDRFAVALKFGTAGLRGVLGAGTNRMNIYVVRQATQGLANWVLTQGGTRSTPVSCRRASPWRPRVSRLMRMTRAVGVSQAKTRGLRGVNPFLSRFLGLSCFGGLTDFQKTLKKNSKTGISCNRCACFVI